MYFWFLFLSYVNVNIHTKLSIKYKLWGFNFNFAMFFKVTVIGLLYFLIFTKISPILSIYTLFLVMI